MLCTIGPHFLGRPKSALAGPLDMTGGSVLSVIAGQHTLEPTLTVTSEATSRTGAFCGTRAGAVG